MIPASTKWAPVGAMISPIRIAVCGLTALQSMYTGLRSSVARRKDRQEEIGAGKQLALVRRRSHAGCLGALGAGLTAPRQQGADFGATLVQPAANAGAHHALSDYPDHSHCRVVLSIVHSHPMIQLNLR